MISLSNFGLMLTKDEVTLGHGLNEVLGISNKCFVLQELLVEFPGGQTTLALHDLMAPPCFVRVEL